MPEAREPRNFGGWAVLVSIFCLMIGVQLYQYFKRDVGQPDGKYMEYVTQLKLGVEMRHSFSFLGSSSAKDLDKTLKQIEEKLAPDAVKDATAARIYAAARSEQGKDIPQEVVARLRTSKEPRDKHFAEIFSAKKLAQERAKQLEKALQGGGFISKLAIVEAHEKAGDKSRRDRLIPKSAAYMKIGVLSAVGLAGLGGLILLILYGILKSQGLIPRLGFPLGAISLPDADRLALRCAQLFAMFLAVPLAMSFLVRDAFGKHTATLILYSALLAGTIYLFRFPIGGKRISLSSIGINRQNIGKNIAWGIGAALANLPLVLGFALLGQWLFSGLPRSEHPTTVEIQAGVSLYGTLVIIFAASVGAPILEEVMFRGTLLPALSRVLSPVLAILIQAFIFAAIHPTGIPAWLPLATIGATSGFLSRQTGSLVPSIVMHSVHNFGTLVVAKTLLG